MVPLAKRAPYYRAISYRSVNAGSTLTDWEPSGLDRDRDLGRNTRMRLFLEVLAIAMAVLMPSITHARAMRESG